MFASLQKFDAVIAGTNGGPCVVQTDHRSAEEIAAARELSTVFALLRVLEPKRVGDPEPEVRYYLTSMPPAFLVEAVAAAGGRVFVGESPKDWVDVTDSAGGKRPRPAEQIANEAMSALARRTAAEAGLPLDRSGLQRYEKDQLTGDDDEIEMTDDDGNVIETEPEDDGGEEKYTKIVKLASYAGEVLGSLVKGRWLVSMDHTRPFSLQYECQAGDKEIAVNLLGKGLKLTENGMEDSLALLVSAVVTMARGK